MRITTLALAATLLVSATGSSFARDYYLTQPDNSERGPSRELSIDRYIGSDDNPAGVIDGTNPNPNPTQAGGILSSSAAVNRALR